MRAAAWANKPGHLIHVNLGISYPTYPEEFIYQVGFFSGRRHSFVFISHFRPDRTHNVHIFRIDHFSGFFCLFVCLIVFVKYVTRGDINS